MTKKGPYHRYVINIPDSVIHELGWEQGVDLEPRVEKGRLVLVKT